VTGVPVQINVMPQPVAPHLQVLLKFVAACLVVWATPPRAGMVEEEVEVEAEIPATLAIANPAEQTDAQITNKKSAKQAVQTTGDHASTPPPVDISAEAQALPVH